MSDLLKLETLSAPPLTTEHCLKRCLALQSTIDSARAFIHFLSNLDATMRLSFLNYLHTQVISPTSMEVVEEISSVYSEESKTYTQSLSPKKSKAKPKRSQKSQKKPSPVI